MYFIWLDLDILSTILAHENYFCTKIIIQRADFLYSCLDKYECIERSYCLLLTCYSYVQYIDSIEEVVVIWNGRAVWNTSISDAYSVATKCKIAKQLTNIP